MNPADGMFLSKDPVLGVLGGQSIYWNSYAYVHNNPVNLTDPSGEIPLLLALPLLGALTLLSVAQVLQDIEANGLNEINALQLRFGIAGLLLGLGGFRFTVTPTGGLTITPQGGLMLAPTRVTVGVGVRPLPFLPPHITLFADGEQDSSTSNNQVIPGNRYETPTGKKWSVNADKKVEQMRVRGWTVEEINMVLDNPADSAAARAKNATATVYSS